jgi:cytochrome b
MKADMKALLIWDLPTRLFHWLFAASFAGAYITAESDAWLGVHIGLGYLMLGLIGFRLFWGFAGGHYARFSNFLFSPMQAWRYLRETLENRAVRHLGHNPAGSWAVYFLLALGLAVSISGLFVQGGEEQQGVAAAFLGYDLGHAIKEVHEAVATLMFLLVFGHIAGVVLESRAHRENLARSMVTGIKQGPDDAPVSRPYRLIGLLILLGVAGFSGGWFHYAAEEQLDKLTGQPHIAIEPPHVAFVGKPLAGNATWREECGSCHLDFHPGLLPARSWEKLFAEQNQHFGDDLGLDAAGTKTLLTFALENEAGGHRSEAAWKIDRSIKSDSTPVRITETPYWVKKHRDIADADWRSPKVRSKANCAACHLDAQAGTFEDAAMRMPK